MVVVLTATVVSHRLLPSPFLLRRPYSASGKTRSRRRTRDYIRSVLNYNKTAKLLSCLSDYDSLSAINLSALWFVSSVFSLLHWSAGIDVIKNDEKSCNFVGRRLYHSSLSFQPVRFGLLSTARERLCRSVPGSRTETKVVLHSRLRP